jgi:hypothetical protein
LEELSRLVLKLSKTVLMRFTRVRLAVVPGRLGTDPFAGKKGELAWLLLEISCGLVFGHANGLLLA